MLKIIRALIPALLLTSVVPSFSQDIPKDVKDRIDELISPAYQAAVAQFPCKVSPGGKARIVHWQQVDRCLNRAAGRVDWEDLTKKLESLRAGSGRLSRDDFTAAVEASLSAHALTFESVFSIKSEKALLPLTNSLLRFLPPDSLRDLPVFDSSGARIGTFVGIYTFERMGALASANAYHLTFFQYADASGNVQPAGDKNLLLDNYGVPWRDARAQRGFRLTSERLPFVRQ